MGGMESERFFRERAQAQRGKIKWGDKWFNGCKAVGGRYVKDLGKDRTALRTYENAHIPAESSKSKTFRQPYYKNK